MSTYDRYEVVDDGRRHRHRHDRDRDDREPRYVETQETYVRAPAVPVAPETKYVSRQTELVRAPRREDSDLSVEEVRRDFPPPGSGVGYAQRTMVREDRYGPVRARSVERDARYYDEYEDPRRSYQDVDRRGRRSMVKEKTVSRHRSLSRNQKIIAAVGGAALAVGGKELWDRRQADGRPITRNPLSTAALGAAGAFAGYEGAELYSKHGDKYGEKVKTYISSQGRDGHVEEYEYSDEEEVRPKRSKSRRKSIVEGALGLAGLGAAAKAVGGGSHKRRGSADSYYSDRSTRSRKSTRSRRARSVGPDGAAKFQQAAKAALLAGATEAFRVRKEPGGWGGAKGRRILTAAIGAGGIDAAADRDPDHKSKRHILEAVVGGLAGNRLINGSRSNVGADDEARSIRSRSRSRSRSRGPNGGGGGAGLAALATAGLGAIAGKKLLDRSRSRSRGGGSRRQRYSSDSYDSRSPSPRRGDRKSRHRSKSVTDYARKGLAAIGLGEASEHGTREVEETHVIRKTRRRGSDDGYDRRSRDVEYGRDEPYGDSRYADSRSSLGGGRRSARQKDGQRNRRVAEGRMDESDTESLGSSSGDEKRIKKMKGKQLLTAGLATVATIHAAHNIYSSMEKRDARRKAVQEGEMTPEEARKLKAKATLQDAASVGIAALGIKGAISEIKEANEMRKECREFNEKKEERHRKRMERQKALSRGTGRNGDSKRRDRYDNSGPYYVDANPYAPGLPAPPVGYYDGR
ncbi:hypothetical protein BP5796_00296 [Coleophoma crateriformis]|uniref:DUF3824 domain-containing protein n=1 Tax=Coleophoma crateriformis TaxID=565419 RepID=A0A3D8T7I2_9HELO|nr:hypothetical protein BP5796_00296 [Coleophoma crateriformis]